MGMAPEERERLILSIDPVVQGYARKVSRYHSAIEYDDVLQDGRIGAMRAAESWDPSYDNTFLTYAMHRVRGEIQDGLRRRDVMSRSMRRDLDQDDPRWVQASLDAPVGEGLTFTLGDLLVAQEPTPEDVVADASYFQWQSTEAQIAMMFLSAYERDVVRDYYWRGLCMREIGNEMGVTESRVCQMLNGALAKLERTLSARDELVS